MTRHTGMTLILVGAAIGCAVALMRREAQRLVHEHDEQRQLNDWESEGGATATQPQVPGGDVGPSG